MSRPSIRKRHPSGFGGLTPDLMIALDRQAHQTAANLDHETAVISVGNFLAAMDDEIARFSAIRRAAIASLRDAGHSYDRIASRTGLSKSRVAQLSRTLSTS